MRRGRTDRSFAINHSEGKPAESAKRTSPKRVRFASDKVNRRAIPASTVILSITRHEATPTAIRKSAPIRRQTSMSRQSRIVPMTLEHTVAVCCQTGYTTGYRIRFVAIDSGVAPVKPST